MTPAPPRTVTLTIAVTPLVKRAVLASTKGKPLYVSQDHRRPFNPYESYLFALLDKGSKVYTDSLDRTAGLADLTQTLEIEVPAWYKKRGLGVLIPPARQLAFNQFVIKTVRERMREEIAVRMSLSVPIRQAATQTMERLNLSEDEYPLLAVIRHYYRHRGAVN